VISQPCMPSPLLLLLVTTVTFLPKSSRADSAEAKAAAEMLMGRGGVEHAEQLPRVYSTKRGGSWVLEDVLEAPSSAAVSCRVSS
jgi:hypothetical protein